MGDQAPLGFWDPLGLSADKDVEVFKRPGGILDTHETYDATVPQVAMQNACPVAMRRADHDDLYFF